MWMLLRWPYWQNLFVDYPWLTDAAEWLHYAKGVWDQYQSIAIVIALWLVARKLGRERELIEERVDTLSQHVKAAIEASDAAIAAAKEASDGIVAAFASSELPSGLKVRAKQVQAPPHDGAVQS